MDSRVNPLFLFVFLCFLAGVSLPHANAAPVLEEVLFPGKIQEDQEVRIRVTLEWPDGEGDYVCEAPQDLALVNLRLLDLSESKKTSSSGNERVSRLVFIYRMLPLQEGQAVVPAFDIPYRKTGTQKWGKVHVPKIQLDIMPPMHWAGIVTLLSVLGALTLFAGIWFLCAAQATKRSKEAFLLDPTQQIYKDAVKKFSCIISEFTPSDLQSLFPGWSDELKKVAVTFHKIPVFPATLEELLKELAARNVRDGEIEEIGSLLRELEYFSRKPGDITNDALERIPRSLRGYAEGKILRT